MVKIEGNQENIRIEKYRFPLHFFVAISHNDFSIIYVRIAHSKNMKMPEIPLHVEVTNNRLGYFISNNVSFMKCWDGLRDIQLT